MTTNHVDPLAFRALLLHACDRVEAAEAELNALDSAIGDGDHGITMRIGFQAVRKRITELEASASVARLFGEAGKAFMRNAGGAIGVLLGRALSAAGAAAEGYSELGPAELRKLFAAMETTVAATGKAKPGDKTMLDALHAAAEAAAHSPDNVALLLAAAAEAANRAAQATASMACRVGRASRLGARAVGHRDPGAVSFALIVSALAERVRDGLPAAQAAPSNLPA